MISIIPPAFMSACLQHMVVTYFTIGLLFPRRCTNEAHMFCLLLKPHFASVYKACAHRRGYLSTPADNNVVYCVPSQPNWETHSSASDVHLS